ncbi:capsular polysaccharide synthesis protein [Parapedobacter lycopersici]|uniref:capsular polysaccharide synthesis protein n=1 Tax=Parapedobacter lycopersici TaxID=1864939 RepID=UPI00214D3F7B|nr:capsular polysaccharide synthesis protein [Parapedobacter lycopersici]
MNLEAITTVNGVRFVVWCYWSGSAMTPNRARSFDLLKQHVGVPVFLVTPGSMNELEVDGHPIHPAFRYLSAVHQSDYLRIYLLHHYGGAWHDIKATNVSLEPAWAHFSDPAVYLVGRPERAGGPATVYDAEGRWMPDYWQDLVSVTAWVGRAGTPLTEALYRQLHQLLDAHLAQLKAHPAKHPREKKITPRNPLHALFIWAKCQFTGRNSRYPLPWTVFGNIFHPLNYRFREHIRRDLPRDEVKNAGVYHR